MYLFAISGSAWKKVQDGVRGEPPLVDEDTYVTSFTTLVIGRILDDVIFPLLSKDTCAAHYCSIFRGFLKNERECSHVCMRQLCNNNQNDLHFRPLNSNGKENPMCIEG